MGCSGGKYIFYNLPPKHPIMSFETVEIKMAAVSVKRSKYKNQTHSSKATLLFFTFDCKFESFLLSLLLLVDWPTCSYTKIWFINRVDNVN